MQHRTLRMIKTAGAKRCKAKLLNGAQRNAGPRGPIIGVCHVSDYLNSIDPWFSNPKLALEYVDPV